MDDKDERIEKAINEIYCDLDLDGQEDWDRVSSILYKSFRRQAQEAPKAESDDESDVVFKPKVIGRLVGNLQYVPVGEAPKDEDNFGAWWDSVVKGGQWTTLERMAAHDAWEYQRKKYEAPKAVGVQSAVSLNGPSPDTDYAKKVKDRTAYDLMVAVCALDCEGQDNQAIDEIEADRAAQRQAGREEAEQELSDNWCAYWKAEWMNDWTRQKKTIEVDEGYMRTLDKEVEQLKEEKLRYAAVVEAAKEAYKLLMLPKQYEDDDRGQRFELDIGGDDWGIPREALRKALDALDEARKT
jgi:hypothetical protein